MTVNRQNIKDRVHKEPDKLRQVTHWDIDYLPLAEIDSLYSQNQVNIQSQPSGKSPRDKTGRLPLILIAAGSALLILSLTIAARL